MNFFRGRGGSGLMSYRTLNKNIKKSLKPVFIDGELEAGLQAKCGNLCNENEKSQYASQIISD